MTDQITRDGDIITIKSETTRVIDLAQLRAELESLALEEPDMGEVVEYNKIGTVHPYYDPGRQLEIDRIKAELDKWEQ